MLIAEVPLIKGDYHNKSSFKKMNLHTYFVSFLHFIILNILIEFLIMLTIG